MTKRQQYYVARPDQTQEGPYDEQSLLSRYRAGKYPEGTLVWCEGMDAWKSLQEVFPSSPATPPTPEARPAPPPLPGAPGNSPEQDTSHQEAGQNKNRHKITYSILLIVLVAILAFFLCGKSDKDKALEELARIDPELPRLTENGANFNAKDEKGNTALMYASERGATECVKALIAVGTRLNATNKGGNTALMLAVEKNIRTVRTL